MTEATKLGKINNIRFGFGGYDDAMFGVSFELDGAGWGVNDFWGQWTSDPSPHAQWTKEDRMKDRSEMIDRLIELFNKAKVNNIDKLVGKPIEITFKDNWLKSWRILEEVL